MFSGVGGFHIALNRLGHKCVGYSEVDKYCIQVYEKHFGGVKNYGDAKKIDTGELPEFDMLCGGFPCQSFSIAGKRRGFEDTRGTLFFEIARIVKIKRPKIVLLENVKGLLNHDEGETFRIIIQTLWELGYDVQWVVCNSKFFGVPQNRERVFIIGSLRGTGRFEVLPFGEDAGTIQGVPGKETAKMMQLVGDRDNPGISIKDEAFTIPANPMSDRGQLVARCLRARDYKGSPSPKYHYDKGEFNLVISPVCVGLVPETCKKRMFDTPKEINQFLINHKCEYSIKVIAEKIGLPKTQVEHYFRTDKSRAIPSPDVWLQLKKILSFDDTFDRQVTDVYRESIGSPCLTKNMGDGGNNVPMVMNMQTRSADRPSLRKICPCGSGKLYQKCCGVPEGSGTLCKVDEAYCLDKNCTQGVSRVPLKFLSRNQKNIEGDYAFTVDSCNTGGLNVEGSLRRLTPVECERLQGFPDRWTRWGLFTEEFISYNKLGTLVCKETKIKKLQTKNVQWKIVKEEGRPISVIALCTTRDGKGMEMQISSLTEQKDIGYIKNLNVDVVMKKSENMGHWDCVLDIIKCKDSTKIHYISKRKGIRQAGTDILEKETEKIHTEELWKKQSEGNFDPMKSYIISTAINSIIDSLIYSYAHAKSISLSIEDSEIFSKGKLIWKVSDLKMDIIREMSDTSRYKQMGNAVTVNVVEVIARRLVCDG